MAPKLAVVVAAGGESSRLGAFKPLMPLRGRPLISYALDFALRNTPNIYVLLRSNAQAKVLGNILSPYKASIIYDRARSPIFASSLAESLTQVKEDIIFLMGCDTPLLDQRLPKLLLTHLGDSAAAVPALPNGYIEPLAALYVKSFLSEGKKATSLRGFCKSINAKRVGIDELGVDPTSFFNVNRLEDLEGVEKFL